MRSLLTILAALHLCSVTGAGAADYHRVVIDNADRTVMISMTGSIVAGDVERLTQIISSLPAGDRLRGIGVDSPGGLLIEAEKLADLIAKRSLSIFVFDHATCASACFLLFAAGGEKFFSRGAYIGVHSVSNGSGLEDAAAMTTTTRFARVLSAYNVPPAIIGKLVITRPGKMTWLTGDELVLMGATFLQSMADRRSAGEPTLKPRLPAVPQAGAPRVNDWTDPGLPSVLPSPAPNLRQPRSEDHPIWASCADPNPDLAIISCTALIQSGQETTAQLAAALGLRGMAHSQKGQHDRAIQDLDDAIRLNPNSLIFFTTRGGFYNATGKYDRALLDHDHAIRLDPSSYSAFNARGQTYHDKGQYDRAIQDFDVAIHIGSSFPDVRAFSFHQRGNAYYAKGQYDRAIEDYDQAIRLNPNDPDAFINRGSAYSAKGQHDRAIQDHDQAIRLKPDYAAGFYFRGLAYFSKGLYQRAIQNYDQAIRLNSKYAAAFSNRGTSYRALGQRARAAADFAKARQLDPALLASPQ